MLLPLAKICEPPHLHALSRACAGCIFTASTADNRVWPPRTRVALLRHHDNGQKLIPVTAVFGTASMKNIYISPLVSTFYNSLLQSSEWQNSACSKLSWSEDTQTTHTFEDAGTENCAAANVTRQSCPAGMHENGKQRTSFFYELCIRELSRIYLGFKTSFARSMQQGTADTQHHRTFFV